MQHFPTTSHRIRVERMREMACGVRNVALGNWHEFMRRDLLGGFTQQIYEADGIPTDNMLINVPFFNRIRFCLSQTNGGLYVWVPEL